MGKIIRSILVPRNPHLSSQNHLLFPTSLCGVLVFGCPLPPAFLPPAFLPPSPLHTTSHLHTAYPHTTYTHTHTTYPITPAHLRGRWHLGTSTFTLPCKRGTYGVGLALVTRLGPGAALCVAGVALGDIDLRFVWQAWHLGTLAFVLRGRRDTYGIGLALVTRLGPGRRRCRRGTLRGRRGTWRHRPSLCVPRRTYGTGLALVTRSGPGGRRGRRGTLCGRRGTW